MKQQVKGRFYELHINPISRDIILIMILGLFAAIAVSTVAAMILSRW